MTLDDIIDRLIEARRSSGRSQRDVARAIGVDPGTLSDWENRTADPGSRNLDAWTNALGQRLYVADRSDYEIGWHDGVDAITGPLNKGIAAIAAALAAGPNGNSK